MKNAPPRIVLACILILMPTVAAFGQQEANLQNAVTYDSRGLAKEKKGDSVEKNAPNNLESYS